MAPILFMCRLPAMGLYIRDDIIAKKVSEN